MELFARIFGILIFGVSSIAFLRVYQRVWPNLTLKKILFGLIVSGFIGIGMVLAMGIPLAIDGILIAGLFASLGGVFLLIGHWVSNKLFVRYNKTSLIHIKEVIMTTTVDEKGFPIGQSYSFHQTDSRIYCFIIHYSVIGSYFGTTLIADWYHEAARIKHHTCRIHSEHPITLWIEPLTRDGFLQGRYKVEFFIERTNRVLIKTVEFEVV